MNTERIDGHRNKFIKEVLNEQERSPEIDTSTGEFRTLDAAFKRAKSKAKDLFSGNRDAIEALLTEKFDTSKYGFSAEKMLPKNWNWLFRVMEKEHDAEGMKMVYDAAPEGEFKSSWIVREKMANAFLLRASDLFSLGEIDIGNSFVEDSRNFVFNLQKDGDKSSYLDRILGNYFLLKSKLLDEKREKNGFVAFLQEAAINFEIGFMKDFDTNVGLRLIQTKMRYALETGDEEELKDAFRIAEIVEICAMRDGGIWSNDIRILSNILEISLINGKDFEYLSRIFDKLVDESKDDNDVHNEEKLKSIRETFYRVREKFGDQKYIDASTIRNINVFLGEENAVYPDSAESPEYGQRRKYTQVIFDFGLQFKHLYDEWISGNYKRRGILTPTLVTDADKEYARSKLKEWYLDALDDLQEFDSKLDKILIEKFKPNGMERIGSAEQANHKKRIRRLMEILQVNRNSDATTNLSVYDEMGLGDCRWISIDYQHFRDVWWSDRINFYLSNAMERRKEINLTADFLQSAKKILKKQSVLLNFSGKASIDVDSQTGFPTIHEATGAFIESFNDPVFVENHTMPVDVELDDNFVIEKVHFNDPLGHAHRLDGNFSEDLSPGYTAEQIAGGNLEVGSASAFNYHINKVMQIPVYYSLDIEVLRRQRVDPELTFYGDRFLMGIPVPD